MAKNMSEALELIEASSPAFCTMQFDPRATRSFNVQASGFHWSDEIPHKNTDLVLPSGYHQLLIFVLSYRTNLVFGSKIEAKYKSVWGAFCERCSDWPGLHPSRCSPNLSDELQAEIDTFGEHLDRLGRICERRRRQRDQGE